MQATQTPLFDTHTCQADHDAVAFDIGLAHARLGLNLPGACAQPDGPLAAGWRLGQQRATLRMVPTVHHRRWLNMRLRAWLHGQGVDLLHVNPNYVAQLDVPQCPVTRVSLLNAAGHAAKGQLTRLRHDAAWAPGHLALVSTSAMNAMRRAPTDRPHQVAWETAQQLSHKMEMALALTPDQTGHREVVPGQGGLNAAAWFRLAVLHSFVQLLPHEEAARIPLLLLPPNRVQLLNPIQALQAYITRQFLLAGWSQRLSRMEKLMPSAMAAAALRDVVLAMVPRVLSLYPQPGNLSARHALEDAWQDPRLQQRWQALAGWLTPEQCEGIVQRAQAQHGGPALWQASSVSQALENWSIATKGSTWPRVA